MNGTMRLLVVESPSKIKAIAAYAGDGYRVVATAGHLMDLPAGRLAVDTETMEVELEVVAGKRGRVHALRQAAQGVREVVLAGDPDREGEAICAHAARLLGLSLRDTARVRFHEITGTALRRALESPGRVDTHLYDAQQARRVIDRLTGYTLSPLLCRALGQRGLSAGRVQSAVLRLVCARQEAAAAHASVARPRIRGSFGETGDLVATLNNAPRDWDHAEELVREAKDAIFTAGDMATTTVIRAPPRPFTTSTLQQAAHRDLKLPVQKTMALAQKLFQDGRITYIRTDKAVMSPEFVPIVHRYVAETHGDAYVGAGAGAEVTKRAAVTAQEAHEAIRPTRIHDLGDALENDEERRLYKLIWTQAVRSCMAAAQVDRHELRIHVSTWNAARFWLLGRAETLRFPGHLVLVAASATAATAASALRAYGRGAVMRLRQLVAEEHHADPPAAYTEASLVAAMEAQGVGRPSTYAASVATVRKRGYVEPRDVPAVPKEVRCVTLAATRRLTARTKTQRWGGQRRRILPTDVGTRVDRYLRDHAGAVADVTFTAHMESQLDQVAAGHVPWRDCVRTFYATLRPVLEQAAAPTRVTASLPTVVGTYRNAAVRLVTTRHGPCYVVQTKKPRFVNIPDGHDPATLTWDQVKFLVRYPHNLGDLNSHKVLLRTGRHGRYLEWNGRRADAGPETFSSKDIDARAIFQVPLA
jgi:DNA topoisomerase-1